MSQLLQHPVPAIAGMFRGADMILLEVSLGCAIEFRRRCWTATQ
ncbi:MAG TPA: hypothetical protein V6D18_06805 [Thermosynechococcaceae cyanobacterium]